MIQAAIQITSTELFWTVAVAVATALFNAGVQWSRFNALIGEVKGVRRDMHTTKEVIDTHREQLIQHESDIKHINARLENFSA